MRNPIFTILKALAIVLVVLGHSGCPEVVKDFVYQFHVPAFFLCAGYFFHTKYLDDAGTYIGHRFKGLYVPFVTWSVFFLLIHNLLLWLGLLSTSYGNMAGMVSHAYSWHEFSERLLAVVFNMSGYDDFLCSPFWFFRSLFVGSLLWLLCFNVGRRLKWLGDDLRIALGVAVSVWALALWQSVERFDIAGFTGGGYRELTGLMFIALGFAVREVQRLWCEDKTTFAALRPLLSHRAVIVSLPWICTIAALALLLVTGCTLHPIMTSSSGLATTALLPVTGLCGFYLLYRLSALLSHIGGFVGRALRYMGENTLYIFAFHFLAFKLVSAIKVGVYGLPWQAVGSHAIVHAYTDDNFWLCYTLVGVALPLLWIYGYRRLMARHGESIAAVFTLQGLWRILRFIIRLTVRLIRGTIRGIGRSIKLFGTFCRGMIAATMEREDNDEEEEDDEEEENVGEEQK